MKSMLEWCRKQSNVARVGHTMSCELISKAQVQYGRANKSPETPCKSNCTDQKEFTCKAHSIARKKHSDRVGMTIEGVCIHRTANPDPNSLHMQRAALHMHGTYLHAFVSWGEATWTEKRAGRTRGLLPPPLFERGGGGAARPLGHPAARPPGRLATLPATTRPPSNARWRLKAFRFGGSAASVAGRPLRAPRLGS